VDQYNVFVYGNIMKTGTVTISPAPSVTMQITQSSISKPHPPMKKEEDSTLILKETNFNPEF